MQDIQNSLLRPPQGAEQVVTETFQSFNILVKKKKE